MMSIRQIECLNALYIYFETLFYLNRNIITLAGLFGTNDLKKYETPLQKCILDIPKLIPFIFDNKRETYVIKNNEGLMDYADQLPFLKDDFERILKNHYDVLKTIKCMRNKLEHQPHALIFSSFCSGRTSFNMTYHIIDETYCISFDNLSNILLDLNTIYAKIQDWVKSTRGDHELENRFVWKLTRYSFLSFNTILQSDLLPLIAPITNDF